jgi:hypothetical protein
LTCPVVLLRVLLSLAVWHQDADLSPDARSALYRPVAEAICRVSRTTQEQAWLAAQAYSETTLAAYVIEGRCADGPPGIRCDEGRATTEWQVHRFCIAAWTAPTLDERREAGARCALKTARRGLTVCGVAGAFGFQTGRRVCEAPWLEPRVRLYRWILSRIEAQR